MRVSSRWFFAILVCAGVFVVLGAIKYFQIQAAIAFGQSFPEPSESVEAVTTATTSFGKSFNTIGEVVAPQSLELRNEIEGIITAVKFVSGDRVTKGDVLVQLDTSEEVARLKAAQARADLAKLELDRTQRLAKQNSVSQEAVDQSKANYNIANADVMAIQASIDKKTLRAPFDGIAGIHTLNDGEYLQSNTFLVNLVGLNDFTWVDFNVPMSTGAVDIGTEITVVLPESNESIAATVIARDATASVSSRNLKIRARIDMPVELASNTIVKITVPLGEADYLQIPRIAVLVNHRGDYVYVLKKESGGKEYRAQRRYVELGDKNEAVVTILSGLEAGELIAADGAFKLEPDILTYVRERPAGANESVNKPAAEPADVPAE